MSDTLTIDHPRFKKFYKRLLRKLESTSRIPKHSYFYKDREGQPIPLGVDQKKSTRR